MGSGERWPILNKKQKLIGWVLRGKESATINLQGLPAITFAVRQRFPSLTLDLSRLERRGKESATINLQGLPAITFAVRQRFPSLTLDLSRLEREREMHALSSPFTSYCYHFYYLQTILFLLTVQILFFYSFFMKILFYFSIFSSYYQFSLYILVIVNLVHIIFNL